MNAAFVFRPRNVFALAVFCFWGVVGLGAQSLDTADSIGVAAPGVRLDTLRPRAWALSHWDGAAFRPEVKGSGRLGVPLSGIMVPISALGSAEWNLEQGLGSRSGFDQIGLPYWQNAMFSRPEDWKLRKGPLPVVDWLGCSAHGRGQEFGVVASASPTYYRHFWIDYRRLQMRGGLLTEDHFNDRFTSAFWGRDSAATWKYAVRFGFQRSVDGETGGVLNTNQLIRGEDWQPNRNLVTTRWSTAERSGRTLVAKASLVHARSNLGLHLGWSQLSAGFGGSPNSVDSLRYSVLDLRIGNADKAIWAEPGQRGVDVNDVLPRVVPVWSAGVRLAQGTRWQSGIWVPAGGMPRWSPVASWSYPGHRNRVQAELDVLGMSATLSYARQKWMDLGSNPWVSVTMQQRWVLPWEGDVVDYVQRVDAWIAPLKGLRFTGVASSADPLLTVETWNDAGAVWIRRSAWASVGAVWNARVVLGTKWSMELGAQGRWASSDQLGLAPGFGSATVVYESAVPKLYPGMRVRFELRGQGWTGGWRRPIWVAEKGLFAWSENAEGMPAGGLVHAAAMVYLGEAQLGILAQNANQGWVPNTVFMAQNYPVTPATIRWFLRWRMFE